MSVWANGAWMQVPVEARRVYWVPLNRGYRKNCERLDVALGNLIHILRKTSVHRKPSLQPTVMVFKAACLGGSLCYCTWFKFFFHVSVCKTQRVARDNSQVLSTGHGDWLVSEKHPRLAPFISRVMSQWLAQDKTTDRDGEGGRNHHREKPRAGVWCVLGIFLLSCHACILSPFLSSSPSLPLAVSLNDI